MANAGSEHKLVGRVLVGKRRRSSLNPILLEQDVLASRPGRRTVQVGRPEAFEDVTREQSLQRGSRGTRQQRHKGLQTTRVSERGASRRNETDALVQPLMPNFCKAHTEVSGVFLNPWG